MRTLILTDGKMGDLAQCRGVADALGFPRDEITVRPGRLARILGLRLGDQGFEERCAALCAPPGVILASGRRTLPYLRALRARWPDALSVFLKDPRSGTGTADLIWVPQHDRLRGPNVLVTPTAPHGFTAQCMADAAHALEARLGGGLPRPWLGVLVGGKTARVAYGEDDRTRLLDAVGLTARHAGAVLVTASRRTPPGLVERLRSVHQQVWVWDGSGENPYAGLLGACDALFVTGDSHNMVSEALATGRQVIVFRPQGLPAKFGRFLDGMQAAGLVMPPAPMDPAHRQPPQDATAAIATRIRQLLFP